jgi:hypothetical protein
VWDVALLHPKTWLSVKPDPQHQFVSVTCKLITLQCCTTRVCIYVKVNLVSWTAGRGQDLDPSVALRLYYLPSWIASYRSLQVASPRNTHTLACTHACTHIWLIHMGSFGFNYTKSPLNPLQSTREMVDPKEPIGSIFPTPGSIYSHIQ